MMRCTLLVDKVAMRFCAADAGERDAVSRAVARDKPGDVGGHPPR